VTGEGLGQPMDEVSESHGTQPRADTDQQGETQDPVPPVREEPGYGHPRSASILHSAMVAQNNRERILGHVADVTDDALLDAVLASSQALVALAARSIATAKGVTLPQFRMLVVLRDAPRNLTHLAEALDVAASTALRMVDRLIAAGLVERSIPPENRRVTQLDLTPAGARTVHEVTARRRRDLAAVLTRVPAPQRNGLAAAMAAFASAAREAFALPVVESGGAADKGR